MLLMLIFKIIVATKYWQMLIQLTKAEIMAATQP
jgi:hypothetical protein